MANRYWVGGTAEWNNTASTKWATSSGGAGGAAVPTAADDVFFDGNSGSGTISVGTAVAYAKSLTCTGFTGTFSSASTSQLALSGSITLAAGMTMDFAGTISLYAAGTITTAGKSLDCSIVIANDGTNTLGDALTIAGTNNQFYVYSGTFSTGNYNMSVLKFTIYGTISNPTTLNLGSSTISITDATTDAWKVLFATYVTINAGTSTIKFTNNSSTDKTFTGGGKTYYNIWNATSGTGKLIIADSNTFNNFRADAGRTVRFTAGTTTTATSWTLTGTAGNLITLQSSTTSTYTLSQATGFVNADYISYSYSTVTGGAVWYPGANSVDGGNNTGWATTWTNPTNAYSSNNSYATVSAASGALSVQLSKDGGTNWHNSLSKTFTGVESTETYGNGSTELWGTTWIGSSLNDTNFRLRIISGSAVQVYKTFGFVLTTESITGIEVAVEGKWDGSTMSVDHVKVKAYYSTISDEVAAGAIAYASDSAAPAYYNGATWQTLATTGTVPTTITVADTTDTTAFVALFESATGDLAPKTDAGLTYNASTGALTATSLSTATINLTGTGTLNGLDALDATSEATIEAAIDTLANLTSASSLATVGTITSGTWSATDVAVAAGGTGASTSNEAHSNIADFTIEPASDHTAVGPHTNDKNAGESITIMNCVFLSTSDTEWMNTDADAASTSAGILGIALGTGSNGSPLDVALKGSIVRDDTWTWTVGQVIYLSTTTGALTATAPTGTDDVVRVVGYALTDDCIYFDPSPDYVTLV